MPRMGRSTSIVVAFLLSHSIPIFSQPADSAWPMFAHDAQHTGQSPYRGARTGVLEWRTFPTGLGGPISCIIGPDERIFLGSYYDHRLYCLNHDASFAWSYETEAYIGSCPAIDVNGTIYVGPWSLSNNWFMAIQSTGALLWSYWTDNLSSPSIGSDGRIYVGSNDNTVYSFNSTGSIAWSFGTMAPSWNTFSSPAIGTNGSVYALEQFSDSATLWAISSTGSMLWSHTTPAKRGSIGPVIGADGRIYIGDTYEVASAYASGKLSAYESTGTLAWSSASMFYGSFDTGPAIGTDGTIYVGGARLNEMEGNGRIWAFDSSGALSWYYQPFAEYSGGFISIALGSGDVIYATDRDNVVSAIVPSWHELLWSYTVGYWPASTAIGADGRVYVGCNGGLYVFKGMFPVYVNFQPYGTTAPSGWQKDCGDYYSDFGKYGWK